MQPDERGYIEWEADPRHVEILVAQAGLNDGRAKALSTPGNRMPKGANCATLTPAEKQQYGSMTMIFAYLAQDRPDLQHPARELARSMQEPTAWDREQLKRACRYLANSGRIVQRFMWQEMPTEVVVFSDSDHAGYLRTRKSTLCTIAFFGKHFIRSTSATQAVLSLSTGESEFYAAVKSGSIG